MFRATADIVQIDVSVLDRDRQPVHGLTAADFTVLDDGIEQAVVAFAAVDLPDRVVLILFDDCSTPWDPSVLRLSRRIARATIDELGPQDRASVIYTSAATAKAVGLPAVRWPVSRAE